VTEGLRLAHPGDLQAIREIVNDAYAHYIERIGRRPGPMLDDYEALIAQCRVRVLEHEGTVRGVLVLIPQDDAMLLDNVAVSPQAQGMGLGRALLSYAERAAGEAGYKVIRLYTNEAMKENVALYGRLGYVETHRAEEMGFRRVYMSKRLGDHG
jgi:ribosomal protein S18 acetylase RimI-like enzyme